MKFGLIREVGWKPTRNPEIKRLPLLNTKTSQRRRLSKLQSNLNYLKEQAAGYGSLEVPLRLRNEIEATEAEIEAVERELLQD